VDDTYTSGANVQSAAVKLTVAGARVVAAVPVGRVIDTRRRDRFPEKHAFWRRQRGIPFDFGRCCLEAS
jgi:hypothetical protein